MNIVYNKNYMVAERSVIIKGKLKDFLKISEVRMLAWVTTNIVKNYVAERQ